MKKLNFICCYFILLILLACSGNKEHSGLEPDLLKETIDTLRYSQFVDSIQYVNLETTDSCLIGRITDVAVTADRIVVFDKGRATISIFNREGKFLNKIARNGNGPEEYANLYQFEYDEKKDQIIVLDIWKGQLVFYTSKGDYLKSVLLEIKASDFKILPQGGLVVSQAGLDKPTAGLYQVDDSGKVVKLLVGRKSNHLVYVNSDWELCSYDQVVCFMAPNFDNTVYHYDERGLTMAYPFNMKPALKHEYKETVSMEHFEDFVRTGYLEGEKWILASYWSSVEDVRNFLYSKEDGQYWIGKTLTNDLDGISRDGKTSVSQGNKFVFWRENENADKNPILQILHLK